MPSPGSWHGFHTVQVGFKTPQTAQALPKPLSLRAATLKPPRAFKAILAVPQGLHPSLAPLLPPQSAQLRAKPLTGKACSQLQPMGKRSGQLIINSCIRAINNSGSSETELEMSGRTGLAPCLKHPGSGWPNHGNLRDAALSPLHFQGQAPNLGSPSFLQLH